MILSETNSLPAGMEKEEFFAVLLTHGKLTGINIDPHPL